jgi:adenosyl cobinamide kinase/adenosyl cobinamide phosphate guanylyltransferase
VRWNVAITLQEQTPVTLTLIIGGARSGKSTYAQQLADAYQTDVLFVATAEPRDDEMAERIAKHQAERPAHWHTLEEPRTVAQALTNVSHPPPVIVLDCVTLWVTNLLLTEGLTWEQATEELDALLAWYRQHAGKLHLIIVSNEVGLGVVPDNDLTRTFREWLGWFNQRLAAEADSVYLMVAGLAVELKALAVNLSDRAMP